MAVAFRGSGTGPARAPLPAARLERFGEIVRRNASGLSSALFVALAVGSTQLGGSWALTVYLLSFWHYYLYWLAYRFGAVPLGVFKRDAVAMKTVALVVLVLLYLAAPLDAASVAVAACGFLLNAAAARALGADRTYYGHEVTDLPWRRITTFPYSVIRHPMLVGNIAAFAGTLINPDFRAQWWPLAAAHVALNLGLWVMELAVRPQRRGVRGVSPGERRPGACSFRTGCLVAGAGAALGGAADAGWASGIGTPRAAGMGACAAAYAHLLYCCYSSPPHATRTEGPQ